MAKYLLTYHGEMSMDSMPTDPEAMQAVMAEWGAWFESIGAGVVDGGDPCGPSAAIDADGSVSAPASLTGYSIIEADSLEAATEVAKGCPVLANGHTVQISETIPVG